MQRVVPQADRRPQLGPGAAGSVDRIAELTLPAEDGALAVILVRAEHAHRVQQAYERQNPSHNGSARYGSAPMHIAANAAAQNASIASSHRRILVAMSGLTAAVLRVHRE